MSDSKLIDENYAAAVKGIKEVWLNTVSTDWYDYVVALPPRLKVTYLVIALHNQLCNGGFHQYFVNGYGQFSRETIKALNAIGAHQIADLVRRALEHVNPESSPDEVFRALLLKKEIPKLFARDDLFEPLNGLDANYYDNSEDVVRLLGSHLKNQFRG